MSIHQFLIRISSITMVVFASAFSVAQGTSPAAPVPDSRTSEGQQSAQQSQNSTGSSSGQTPSAPELAPPPKRMFGMIPDFGNTNDTEENRRPLTVKQKYVLSLHQAFDISAHIGDAFQAALQQAADGQPRYGQGWDAYGKRFAANEGDEISGSLLIYGVLPSLLREDPRYFRQGRGKPFARIWYAVNRTVITRKDSGVNGFNISEILGQLLACGISTSYYPPQDRGVSRVFSNWGVNLGGNSAYNVLSEYYPDLLRMVFHRHPQPVQPAGK